MNFKERSLANNKIEVGIDVDNIEQLIALFGSFADDITVEADSGGHTDNRNNFV